MKHTFPFALSISCLVIFSLFIPTAAITKEESIIQFLDDMRLSVDGFANSANERVTIKATSLALEIATYVSYDLNNSLDILHFFQNSQNADGGFGSFPNQPSTWDDTMHAIKGLPLLGLNTTKLADWKIFNYINNTAQNLLYETIAEGNTTTTQPKKLTIFTIGKWIEYLDIMAILGIFPTIPFQELTDQLKNMQFPNGSYADLETAIFSNILLSRLGQEPNDLDLAGKYIRAFQTSNGAFSFVHEGKPTLNATFLAIQALADMKLLSTLEYREEIVQFIINLQHPRSGFSEAGGTANMEDTWKALVTLNKLNRLSELIAPEVLLTEGFISFGVLHLIFGIPVIGWIVRRQRSNSVANA